MLRIGKHFQETLWELSKQTTIRTLFLHAHIQDTRTRNVFKTKKVKEVSRETKALSCCVEDTEQSHVTEILEGMEKSSSPKEGRLYIFILLNISAMSITPKTT